MLVTDMTASFRQRRNGAQVSAEAKRAVHAIKWAVQRSRYMTLETIAAIGDDAAVPGLPNMAA